MDDGTFPALLKTLSDSSEEVSFRASIHRYAPGFLMVVLGYQTRSSTSSTDLFALGRRVFQDLHGQSPRVVQHRPTVVGAARKSYHLPTLHEP